MLRLILSFALVASTGVFANDIDNQDHGHEHREHTGVEQQHQDDDDHDQNDHEHESNEDAHDHPTEHVTITSAIAAQTGITVGTAAPGIIKRMITFYGNTTIAPDRLSHIYARFPGIIKTVKVNIGDPVQADAVLAEVESNESLKVYSLTAPINGVITQRHANAGEATRDQLLFAIAGFDPLVAEFQVFPSQLSSIQTGQPVLLSAGNLTHQSQVLHLLPGEGETSAMEARAPIPNPENRWSPGLLVTAEVEVESLEVSVRIDNRALQSYQGNSVVFVQKGENYAPRPVQTGRRDDTHTEVIAGLQPGERYVVTQSYLIKADLEKAGAEHHH
jgi:membrane fusion protein, heavy metal efflux system